MRDLYRFKGGIRDRTATRGIVSERSPIIAFT